MQKKIILSACVLFFSIVKTSHGQENDLDLLVNDLLKISGDYALPAAQATEYQFDAGWFSSAKSLGLWKVSVSLHGNLLIAPKDKTHTKFSDSDFKTLTIRNAGTAEVPTTFGGDTDVFYDGEVHYFGQTNTFEIQAFEGMGSQTVSHAFLQASVGLPFQTELSVRFVPQIKIEDVGVDTYGFALKHNLNQYFSSSKKNDLQFAVLLIFGKLHAKYNSKVFEIENILKVSSLEVKSNFYSFQLATSKSFSNSNWEIYGAFGLTHTDFEYGLNGGGPALGALNKALEELSDNDITAKGHIGASYKFGHFLIDSVFSFGRFYNYNLGIKYKI